MKRFVAHRRHPSPSSASNPTTPTEFLVYKIVPPAPAATLWGIRNPGTHSPRRGKEGGVRAGEGGVRRGRTRYEAGRREGDKASLPTIVVKMFLGVKGQSLCSNRNPQNGGALTLQPPPAPPPLRPELRNPEMRRLAPSPGHPPTLPLKKKMKSFIQNVGRRKGGREETESCPHRRRGSGGRGLRQQKLGE